MDWLDWLWPENGHDERIDSWTESHFLQIQVLETVWSFNQFQKLAYEVIAGYIGYIGWERVMRKVKLLQLVAILVDSLH